MTITMPKRRLVPTEADKLKVDDITADNGRVTEAVVEGDKVRLSFAWGRFTDDGTWIEPDPEGGETGAWEAWWEFQVYQPPKAKIALIVDARPTCAADLKVGDLVDGSGRVFKNDPLMNHATGQPYPGRRDIGWEDGQGRGPAGTYDDGHHFHLVTVEGGDTPEDSDEPDEAAYLARYGPDQLMFSSDVFAALVSSDWGGLADIAQTGDTIDVRLDGRHYVIDIREVDP